MKWARTVGSEDFVEMPSPRRRRTHGPKSTRVDYCKLKWPYRSEKIRPLRAATTPCKFLGVPAYRQISKHSSRSGTKPAPTGVAISHSPSITAINSALLPLIQIVHCDPISPRSVPHSEEAGRQYHLWRYSGGPALGKFGLVLEHTQTLDSLIFGIERLTAPV